MNREEMLAKIRRDDMLRRLRDSDSAAQAPEKSMLQSGVEAVNDFATNLSNNWIGRTAAEIASYPGAAIQTIGTDKPFEKARQELLAKDQAQYEEAAQRSPYASMGGTILGNVAAGPQGGASAAGQGILGSAKAIGTNAAMDAGIGAADAASQGGDMRDITKSAAMAGLFSAGTGTAMRGAEAVATKVAPAADSLANRLNVKALGGSPKEQEILNANVDEVGRLVRDRKLVRFGDSAERIAGRVDDEIQDIGQRLGNIRSQASGQVDLDAVRAARQAEFNSIQSPTGTEIDRFKEFMAQVPQGSVPIGRSQEMVEGWKEVFQKGQGPTTPSQLGTADAYGAVRQAQNTAIEGSVNPQTFDQYKADMRNRYLLGGADKATDRQAARAQARESIGLKDLAAGGVVGGGTYAASDGDPMTTAAAVVGSKILRSRGPAAAASTADRVARILKSAPQSLGKWGPALQQAASRGALSTNLFLLQKTDPEFRQFLESQEEP